MIRGKSNCLFNHTGSGISFRARVLADSLQLVVSGYPHKVERPRYIEIPGENGQAFRMPYPY